MDAYIPKSVLKDCHATTDSQQSQHQQVQTPTIVVSIAAATAPSTATTTIDHGSYQKATLPYPQSSTSTKNRNTLSSKLLLGAKGNRYSNNNAKEDEEIERRNSEDEADEYEYQEYKRARRLKKQQKQEAKELKAAEKQREKQKKNDRKRALKKAKAGGRRVSVSVSSRRGSQSSESYNQGASGGRLERRIVGGRVGEEQEVGEMVSQGFSTARREGSNGGGVVVMKKRSRVAKLFLRKKPEATQTPAYALMTKATEEEEEEEKEEEGITLQPLERGQRQEEDRLERERDRQFEHGGESSTSPLPGSLSSLTDDSAPQHPMQVDNPSSSTLSFSSASVTPSSSPKPHRLDLSFGINKGVEGGKKEGVKGKGGIAETTTALKSPSSPHGGVAGGGNCGRCYLRRVWSKIKHPHRNSSNNQKPGAAAAVMVPAMITKKSLAAQA